jgi:hypothetical protein
MLPNSRSLRDAAIKRRRAVIRRRAGFVPGALFCGVWAIIPASILP